MSVVRADRPAPGATDLLVAAGCWLVVVGVLLALPLLAAAEPGTPPLPAPGGPGWWSGLGTLTAQAVALVLAGRSPRVVLGVVALLPLPLALAGTGELFSLTSTPVAVAVFLAVLRRPLRALVVPLVLAGLAVTAGEAVNTLTVGAAGPLTAVGLGVVQALGALGAPLLLAVAVVGRREARDARREELRAVRRERDALVRAAVAEERTAMARELHDIAAHHLSGIALVAAALDRQIETDPATARRSVAQVREQTTAVLADLRRLVGLLRTDTEAIRAAESVAAIATLVERRREAGTAVELVTRAAADDAPLAAGVGPVAQLAVYRIAQEALANAAGHAAGAPVRVEVDDRDPGALVLTVTNGPGGTDREGPSGFGLVGMRERADLLGAELHSGPTADGGWQVRVRMPRADRSTAPTGVSR
ncbi:sensor histidine kinase [Desertihabitans brevis]|uniref:sensor histidine kinase n=1 Tax=Desertihabitans brevis TaxID=2268447 RepID=UPI000DED7DCE|nr:histidine kinase [Desertihabitans brevis]